MKFFNSAYNFLNPLKISQPHLIKNQTLPRKSQFPKMCTGTRPPPFPLFIFLFKPLNFHTLFPKKTENFVRGVEPPEPLTPLNTTLLTSHSHILTPMQILHLTDKHNISLNKINLNMLFQ